MRDVRLGRKLKWYSLAFVASAAMLSPAMSADLGGNCCADLEERIAELEATTARKGNRKVSLTITGWVSSQIFWFDDGVEKNVYVVDNNDDLSSNFKFTGTAQIMPGWKAGYSLWVYTTLPSSLTANDVSQGHGTGVSVENSYWWIESDTYGKLSVGKQSLAADNAALGADFSGTLFPANGVTFDGGFLRLSIKGSGTHENVTWQQAAFWCEQENLGIANDCAGDRLNGVRYDSPTFAGFTLGASWGEDDYWDVALRYGGEFHDFKVAFATAYSESTDRFLAGVSLLPGSNDNQYFQIGGMIKHLPTGLWVHGTFGKQFIDAGPVHGAQPDIESYYLKAGLSQKYFGIGQTHIYGEYGKNDDAFEFGTEFLGSPVVGSDATRFGVGVVQEIDAAAMSLWAKWRHHELNTDLANGTNVEFEDVDMFLAGAVIFY